MQLASLTRFLCLIASLLMSGCDDDPCGDDANCEYEACLKTQQWAREHGSEDAANRMQCFAPLPRPNQ